MTDTASEEPSVRYTVRELILRLDGKMDSLTATVALKADKSDLDRLEQRLDGHETRISAVETVLHDRQVRAGVHEERDARDASSKRRWWSRWERVLLVAASVAAAVGILIGVVH